MKLIAGLGNPGKEYALTRHNLGFLVVDMIAKKLGVDWKADKKFSGDIAGFRCDKRGPEEVEAASGFLLKPKTYMNLSGFSVGQALRFYQLQPEQLLVIVDDVALAFGQMRIRPFGSSGGHNGLKSVQEALASDRFHRLRIGIGEPARDDSISRDLSDHVLGKFTLEEQDKLPKLLETAADIAINWAIGGYDAARDKLIQSQQLA